MHSRNAYTHNPLVNSVLSVLATIQDYQIVRLEDSFDIFLQ